MHAQLQFLDPTQVGPNGPRGNSSFGHSFPSRICIIESREIYSRFVIAEIEELRVSGHLYLPEQALDDMLEPSAYAGVKLKFLTLGDFTGT